MIDLLEFLRARLDEDDAVAQQTRKFEQRVPHTERWFASHNDAITSMAPHRAGAEVEAKRRILADHLPVVDGGPDPAWPAPGHCTTCWSPEADDYLPFPCRTVRLVALPYADHPEYDESWRP